MPDTEVQKPTLEPLSEPVTFTLTEPGTEETVAPVETKSAPTIHKHSKRLLTEAIELGLTDEEIDSTPSDELDAKVYAESRKRARSERSRQLDESLNYRRDEPQLSETTRLPDAQPVVDELDDLVKTIDTDDYDANVRKVVKVLADRLKRAESETGNVKKQANELMQFEAQRRNESEAQFIDRLFDQAKRPELFGEGGISKQGRDSDERFKRNQVVAAAQRLDPKLPPEERFALALKKLYGEGAPSEPDTTDKTELADRLKRYTEGQTVRPTNRSGPELPYGRRRAVVEAAKMMGQAVPDDDGDVIQ